MPQGTTFAAGVRQLLFIKFQVSTLGLGSNDLGFGDSPVAREMLDVNGAALNADYVPTQVAIVNPVPSLTSISPTNEFVGSPGFFLTVEGAELNESSVVRFNGADRSTSFLSDTQLQAQILASDLQSPGIFPITVFNPAPGGGTSNTLLLSVSYGQPLPTITSLAPASSRVGDLGLTLTVNGSNFRPGCIVWYNGSPRSTVFVTSTLITAQLSAQDFIAFGTYPVVVREAFSGFSNTVPFTVTVAITSISPQVLPAGGPGSILRVTGRGFLDGMVMRWNGSDRETTVTSGQITVVITAEDLANPGPAVMSLVYQGLVIAELNLFVRCSCGYEGDGYPRSFGDSVISISDWVQIGRFVSGFDTPSGGCEFQRADTAPRSTQGDGRLTIADWVQSGRYTIGEDLTVCAGGPSTPVP
jgi:hypothetical protein